MVSTWKPILQNTYKILDTAEQVSGINLETITLREAFRFELLSFLLYLCAADGSLNSNERDFINELLDYNYTSETYVEFLKTSDIYSEAFEKKAPMTLRIVAEVDKLMLQRNPNSELLVPCLIDLYKNIGQDFLRCDSSYTYREDCDFNIYMTNLENHFLK